MKGTGEEGGRRGELRLSADKGSFSRSRSTRAILRQSRGSWDLQYDILNTSEDRKDVSQLRESKRGEGRRERHRGGSDSIFSAELTSSVDNSHEHLPREQIFRLSYWPGFLDC